MVWCGRVIIVSALSQRKRVKRERELNNWISISNTLKGKSLHKRFQIKLNLNAALTRDNFET